MFRLARWGGVQRFLAVRAGQGQRTRVEDGGRRQPQVGVQQIQDPHDMGEFDM